MEKVAPYTYKNYTVIGKIHNYNMTRNKGYYLIFYCHNCSNKKGKHFDNRVFLVNSRHLKDTTPCTCNRSSNQRNLNDFIFEIQQKIKHTPIEIIEVLSNVPLNSKLSTENITVKYKEKGELKKVSLRIFNKRTFTNYNGYSDIDGLTVSERKQIQKFNDTGKYPTGTRFWRSARKDKNSCSYWYYQCPVCKEDPELYGDAIYEAPCSFFKKGLHLCGCRRTPKWTKEQYLIRIKRKCTELNIEFIGFVGNSFNKCTNTFLDLKCNKGHTWPSTNLDSFLNSSTSCPICANTKENGIQFRPYKQDELDYLYVITLDDNYIKVGRTFNIKSRFSGIRYKSKCKVKCLKLYNGTHKNILQAEQDVINFVKDYKYKTNWTTEAFTLESENTIIEYLNKREDLCITTG